MSDGNTYERRPNRGVSFTHKKGKHPDLMEDGSLEVDIETVCPHCKGKFTAMGSFFMDFWRPKSEKVFRNVQIKQKGVPQEPAVPRQTGAPTHQTQLNYGGGHKPTAKAQDKLLDDEIPF